MEHSIASDDTEEFDGGASSDGTVDDYCKQHRVSRKQRQVVELVELKGFLQTAAYRTVFPDAKNPHVKASRLFRTAKVKGLVDLLRGRDPGRSTPMEREQRRLVLSKQADSRDEEVARKAMADLNKMEAEDREIAERDTERRAKEAAAFGDRTPAEILLEVATGPLGSVFALLLAYQARMPFNLPEGLIPTQADFDALLAPIRWARGAEHPVAGRTRVEINLAPPEPQTPGDRARHKNNTALQNSLGQEPVDGQGRCSSSDAPSTVQRPVSLDPPESWLTDGGHPARVVGALTREQATAAAALNRNYRRR